MIRRSVSIALWRLLAITCLILAVVGVALPVLPTVPFLLVAAWAAGRGWPRLEVWLLAHPRYGPPIRDWRERGVVSRRAKWFATTMMSLGATFMALSPAPLWSKILVPVMMATVAVWLWRRPEH